MESETYTLEVNLGISQERGGYPGLRMTNVYKMKSDSLLGLLKILAELETYTRKLATEVNKKGG